MAATNPLLTPSTLKNKAIPFDQIKEEHFLPAVEQAIQDAYKQVEKIIANKDAANFENTILALETAGETLGVAAGVFYNQLSAAGTDGLQELSEKIGPIQAKFGSDVVMNADLFKRVKAVHDSTEVKTLTTEQKTLLDECYKNFVRGGALLGPQDKDELRKINEELSILSPQFSNNVKKSADAFELWIENKEDLAGLPESALDAGLAMAEEKGRKNAWLFTLDAPSYVPFLTFSSKRELREKIWRAFASRAYGDQYDNTDLLRKLIKLKHRRAQLLGYTTHADFVLERRMAETPARVMEFLDDLKKRYRPAAEKDFNDIKAIAAKDGITDLKPWDVGYYSEKLQQERFQFSSEDLRPYFPLDSVLKGTFDHFSKLLNLKFTPSNEYPVWHEDVTAYDVHDQTSGVFLGTLYADFYPRTGKKPGAWMTSYREQGLFHGKVERPLIAIVCNFTKPTKDKPSLLTHDEVLTLFHEMGHAVHGLLANGTYSSLSGTNVLWDFVELPSQVQENWVYESETLNSFARHYETGEKIPADLMKKLWDSRNFMAAWGALRQVGFSILDMKWHTANPDDITDIIAFEDKALEGCIFFPRLAGCSSVSFLHIFAGGYSAGYYSYKWAEVLDADTFELFKEKGLYDRETAERYKTEILSKGGTEHPAILYRRFRGRDADPKALLRREGLLDAA